MKISIITITFNSDKTLAYTLYSVFEQTYKNIEHILVDGGSTDETLNILKKYKYKNKKIILTKNTSIYRAINIGVKNTTGDYILILNSDDILDNKNVIKNIAEFIKKNKKNIIVLGSVTYFNQDKFDMKSRIYPSVGFKPWMLRFGIMPPHPGAFIPKQIAKDNLYSENFSIASDFDFFLKIFKIKKYNYITIKKTITRMRSGGISGKNLYSHILTTNEILESLKKNKVYSNIIMVYLRLIFKLNQLIFLKEKRKNNNTFKLNENFKKLIKYDFNILKNIKSLNLNKNFVLSGLNLAFLGSLTAKEVKTYNNLIHWPDGIFALKFVENIKKIPGRNIIKNLKIKNKINRLVIFGNLHNQTLEYLKKKFNKPLINYQLPFGTIKKIISRFKFKIKKNDLIFITLPTPKQEQLAEHITTISKKYKIICIGGSLNIISGVEKAVPKYLFKYEYIWRLRYETKRRSLRLIKTFISYIWGKYINKTYLNKSYKIIK
jgi:glycosyltransferase involved in cell wall biosynthesis